MLQCPPTGKIQIICLIVYWIIDKGLEYWLGKTEKIKAGSVLELGFMAVIAFASLFKREKKNGTEP